MMSHKTYEIIEENNSSTITADDLNQERNRCLIIGFCKPHCQTNKANNPCTMYQYALIQEYYKNPRKIDLYTFLSYEQYKTKSIIFDNELLEYSSEPWPLFAKDILNFLMEAKCCMLTSILCQAMCMVPIFIFPLPVVVDLLLILAILSFVEYVHGSSIIIYLQPKRSNI